MIDRSGESRVWIGDSYLTTKKAHSQTAIKTQLLTSANHHRSAGPEASALKGTTRLAKIAA